jgi:hypothetical protein
MCTIVSKLEDVVQPQEGNTSDNWKLELCNSIGSPLDTKIIGIDPMYTTMTRTHIIVCNNDFVYVWQYRNQVAKLTSFESSAQTGIRKLGREIAWFIDDNPDANLIYDREQFNVSNVFIGRWKNKQKISSVPFVQMKTSYLSDASVVPS